MRFYSMNTSIHYFGRSPLLAERIYRICVETQCVRATVHVRF